LSPEQQAELIARSTNNYRRKYPKRWALWHRAMLNGPQPCEVCGCEGRPWFEPHPSVVMLGWRCYACRPGHTEAPERDC
jgi:hypothetical protein